MPTQKQVYAYHPESGEYLGVTTANLSPLDVVETWLIPAYATEQEPPQAGDKQVAIYRDEKWQLIADYRTLKLWSKANAQVVAVKIGDTPDSLQATELEPPPFAVWNKTAWRVDAEAQRTALTVQAQQEIQQKLAAAYSRRRPLEDAVELGMASADEKAVLTIWKRYCVELSRVPQQAGFPVDISWPDEPS